MENVKVYTVTRTLLGKDGNIKFRKEKQTKLIKTVPFPIDIKEKVIADFNLQIPKKIICNKYNITYYRLTQILAEIKPEPIPAPPTPDPKLAA